MDFSDGGLNFLKIFVGMFRDMTMITSILDWGFDIGDWHFNFLAFMTTGGLVALVMLCLTLHAIHLANVVTG